jgi:phosphate transport system substrate-binding protein
MKFKPPIRLPRAKLKTLLAAGAATVGFASLAIAQAGPAAADPTLVYVANGSDTIQDVMNQYSVDLAGNELGSYNAVDPVTATNVHAIITPVKGANATHPAISCSYTRPNGSTEGLNALRKSINPSTTATQLASPPQQGCIDIGRSSSGPGANASTNGGLVYIPFAVDAVGGSVGPATGGVVGGVTTVATAITQANLFTLTDLKNLYANCTNVTEGGVTYNPNTATAGQTQINLYVPQPGSGTRNFWASTLGFNNTTLPACVHDHIVAGAQTGLAVEEHDGTAVATDANGFGPFSVAQFISQRNGHDDRRHGVQLTNVGGIFPCSNNTSCATNGSLNVNFPITREVYNIVEACRVDATAPIQTGLTCSIDPALQSLLVGGNSSLCQDVLTLINYGFAPLPSPNLPDSCGSIATSLRAFDVNTNPI